MKIHTEDRAVATDGTLQSAQFQIKATAKAFKILIDRLYSDKIGAVCRELMTNAYDAHIANGNPDIPFEVRLPNSYDNFFAVRDFGCSMTHDRVMGLYSTVFESTKDNDNTAVGQLGLGSKSPFAYSDTFTVTCWLDGEKRIYTAYIGEDSIPRIDLMLREASDEPQGVEVRIPTTRQDEGDFMDRVKELAYGFDVLPLIKGRTMTLERAPVTFEGPGWRLYRRDGYNSKSIRVRQGCVIYPLSMHAVKGLTDEASGLASMPIVVDFPIGQIDFTPSREEISYNPQTQANIVARLNAIGEEFVQNYTDTLRAIPTEVEARRFAYGVGQSMTSYRLRERLGAIRWRGRMVASEQMELRLKARDMGKVHFVRYGANWFTPNRRNKELYRNVNMGTVTSGKVGVLWYTADQNLKRIDERVRQFRASPEGQGLDEVVCVSCADKNVRAFRRLLVQMGRPVIHDLINYAPPKPVRASTPRQNIMIKRFDEGGRRACYAEADVSEGGWYVVETKRKLPGEIDFYDLFAIVNAARELGVVGKSEQIWLIPSSIEKTTRKKGPWKDLLAVLRDAVADDQDIVINSALAKATASIINDGPHDEVAFYEVAMRRFHDVFIDNVTDTGLGAMFEAFAIADNPQHTGVRQWDAVQTIRNHLHMGGVTLPDTSTEVAKLMVFAGTLKRYPLLAILNEAGEIKDKHEKALYDYVKMIDSLSSDVTLSAAA